MTTTHANDAKPSYEELEKEIIELKKQLVWKSETIDSLAREGGALETIVEGFSRLYLEHRDV